MLCPIFGDEITFAPEIKTWGQALAKGGANLIGGIMEGMMAGALIGTGGALISGGSSALAGGGLRGLGQAGLNLLKTLPANIGRNYLASWTTSTGLAIRGLITAQSGLSQYGETGELNRDTLQALGAGIIGMEIGTAKAGYKVATGQASWEDIGCLVLWMTPITGLRNAKNGNAYENGGIVLKSPKTGFGKTRLAYEYYKGLGWSKNKIADHLSGIDFTKPVELFVLPKGKSTSQYQRPGGSKGNYFAEPNAKATELGINPKAETSSGQIVDKTKTIYETSQSTTVLKSTAKSGIKDTWSVPSEPPYKTTGGGTQYFTKDNSIFIPKK